jgi:hypothetical protein
MPVLSGIDVRRRIKDPLLRRAPVVQTTTSA